MTTIVWSPNFTQHVIVVFTEKINRRSKNAAAIKWKTNRGACRTGRATKASSCWASNSKWKTLRFPWSPLPCSWCSFTSGCISDNATTKAMHLAWRDSIDMQLQRHTVMRRPSGIYGVWVGGSHYVYLCTTIVVPEQHCIV